MPTGVTTSVVLAAASAAGVRPAFASVDVGAAAGSAAGSAARR